jgi:hypothetical protein
MKNANLTNIDDKACAVEKLDFDYEQTSLRSDSKSPQIDRQDCEKKLLLMTYQSPLFIGFNLSLLLVLLLL